MQKGRPVLQGRRSLSSDPGLCLKKWGGGWDHELSIPGPGGGIPGRPRPVGATGNSAQSQAGNLGLTLHGRPFQSVISNNTSVMVCVNAASPFLSFNLSLNCTTGIGHTESDEAALASPSGRL